MTAIGTASGTGLVRRARAVAALAAEHAAEHDANGRLTADVVTAIREGGFARHFVDRRYGGAGGTVVEVCEAVAEVARGCPSTGWVASLAATLGRIAGHLPEEGRQAIWDGGPDTLVVGSLLPLGTAEPYGTGWRVSGEWPYVSSVEFSDWALVLARAPRGPRFVAVPRAAYRIERTWASAGLRGTGSDTLVLDDVVVGPGRSFDRAELDAFPAGADRRSPLEAVGGLAFLPPVLGAARAAMDAWRRMTLGDLRPERDVRGVDVELTLATCSGRLHVVDLLTREAARRADAPCRDPLAVAENVRDCALAADLLVGVTEELVRTGGTRALADGNALQRLWRDVHTGASHVMLSVPRAAAGYARAVAADVRR